jgi:hypothetical protein
MEPGERVEVWCTYTGGWAPGFEIVGVEAGTYRLRRRSDGVVLPGLTGAADLRPELTDQI